MTTIINRTTKGSPLTNAELDQNFTNLSTEITVDNYPTIKPSLLLDFVNAQQLDPRIAFTRASLATCVNEFGLLDTLAANVARIEYDPATLKQRGLLIEEQRTNLLLYSEDFNNASWLLTRATVTANQVVSPSGAVNADKLVEDTSATNTHYLYQPIAVTSGTTYTYSVYAKSAERTRVAIVAFATNSAFTSSIAIFNLATGVITRQDGGFASASITNAGNGWYRCSISIVAAATVSGNIGIGIADLDAALTYTGDGVSGIYIYGAQVETGTFPTSYVPSTTAFTSRAGTSGTYFDSTGTLQTAVGNTARYTYNPQNLAAQPYLLLETGRTNSVRNNTMQGAAVGTPGTRPTNWQYYNPLSLSTQIVSTGVAAGINYVDIRVFGTAASGGQFDIGVDGGGAIAAGIGQTWTNSAWLALVGGSTTNISAVRVVSSERDAANELGNSSTIVQLTNTLTRAAVTRTFTGAGTLYAYPYINILIAAAGAVDITVRIGLPQLEQGEYATSVIPTTTTALTRSVDVSSSAQATRSADLAQISTLSPWYNTSEGTLCCAWNIPDISSTTDALHQIARFTTSGSNPIVAARLGYNTTRRLRYYAQDAGGTFEYAIEGTTNTATTGAFALAWAGTNDFAASENGAAVLTDSTGSITDFTGVNLLQIGAGNGSLNGYLRRVTYYPRRLLNVQLQALTG